MLFKCFLSLFALFLSNTGQANQTLSVHGNNLNFETVNTVGDSVISGVLAEEAVITFAYGNELRLSENTRISFHTGSTASDDLSIYDIFITDNLSQQTWIFSDTKSYEINCSKHSMSANYITFRKNKTLLSGCVIANNQSFIENNLYELEAEKGSRFSLDEEGEFLYAQQASGSLFIDGREVQIADQTGVRLYENKTFRYFTPAVNSFLTVATELGEETIIGQNTNSEFLLPVVFQENGKIESGWFAGEETLFNFEAFGGVQEVKLQNTPLRFNESGQVVTFALIEPLTVQIYRDSLLTRKEVNLNLTQSLPLEAGSLYELPAGAQINLEREEVEVGELKNFTHQDQNGLQFVYREESASSSERLVGLSYQIN